MSLQYVFTYCKILFLGQPIFHVSIQLGNLHEIIRIAFNIGLIN